MFNNKTIMKPQARIIQLQEEIKSLEEQIKNCNHSFAIPIYDPETVREGYGSKQDGTGSDPHWSYAGYHDVQKDRWSRTCLECGKKEYTYKQSQIIAGFKPDFS